MAEPIEPELDDVDGEWIKGLASNRSGRLLSNHLACVELNTKGKGHACAITEALGNERVFIHALARSLLRAQPLPCGLSQPLPLYIAILNLSGERLLAYSDNPSLLRCICTNSNRLRDSELSEYLSVFEAFPMKARSIESSRFVLLTYSLPWQEGTSSAFWHLSACETSALPDGTGKALADRILHFSSASNVPFKGKSVRDVSDLSVAIHSPSVTAMPVVGDKQISDFSESYSSASLDFEVSSVASREAKRDGQTARLHELVQVLKKERVRDQQEIRKMKEASKELQAAMLGIVHKCEEQEREVLTRHKRELEAHRLTAKDMLLVSRQQNDALAAEVVVMRETSKKISSTQLKSIKTHEKLADKHKELQRQGEAKDALNNAALSKHVATISRLEGLVATSDERLASTKSELGKVHGAVVKKLEREHEVARDKIAGALESKKRIINQLSENNDRKDVEKASLQTHVDEQTQRIGDMEVEIKKRRDTAAAAVEAVPKTRSKATSTNGRNASTATHHCASTQTAPPPKPPPPSQSPSPSPSPSPEPPISVPEPAPAPAPDSVTHSKTGPTMEMHISNPDIGLVASMPASYQAAIDMLQELVILTGQTSFHPSTVVHTMPSSYNRPLPFPHFNPIGAYQPIQPFQSHYPQHPQHPHPHSRPNHHPNHHPNHTHTKVYTRTRPC